MAKGGMPYNSWYRDTQSRQASNKAEAARLLQWMHKKLTKYLSIEDPIIRRELARYHSVTGDVLNTLRMAPPSGVSPDNKIQAQEWAKGKRPQSPRTLPPLNGTPSGGRSGRALRGAPSPIPEYPMQLDDLDGDLEMEAFCPATMGGKCQYVGGVCKFCGMGVKTHRAGVVAGAVVDGVVGEVLRDKIVNVVVDGVIDEVLSEINTTKEETSAQIGLVFEIDDSGHCGAVSIDIL